MTATLHDLLKSYREGGVFPSYDQLAAIAGQGQIGAAVRGEAVAEFNINDMMMVTLTPEGAAVWNQRYANLPLPAYLIPEEVDAGYVLKEQLWDLMEVFGPHTGLGRPAMFVGMRMAHTKPVAAIVSARAADAPSEPSVRLDRDCELLTMAQVNAIRDTIKPGDGWDSDDWDFALANAVAANVKSRAADALDSQPTDQTAAFMAYFCAKFNRRDTLTFDDLSANELQYYEFWQSALASSQPTDGGVRNG